MLFCLHYIDSVPVFTWRVFDVCVTSFHVEFGWTVFWQDLQTFEERFACLFEFARFVEPGGSIVKRYYLSAVL